MLTIGERTYELVRSQSGFFLEMDPPHALEPTQQWRLETHWVPSPGSLAASCEGAEYVRLVVEADRYRVGDWRELTGLGLDEPEDDDAEDVGQFYGEGWVEYLLGSERRLFQEPPSFKLLPGCMTVGRKEGYMFSCVFDGTLKLDNGKTEELLLEEELPFAGVSMNVPINGNAVAIGLVRAKREIGELEIDGGLVIPHDWRRKERDDPEASVDDTRRVLLRTNWRRRLA